MNIVFDSHDRDIVRDKLCEAGICTDVARRIADVLYNVEAAFQQQLDYEAEFMIDEFEADH